MDFLEKDLEEIIFTSEKRVLQERGLNLSGRILRQKKIGNYGIADLIEIQKPYYHPYFKHKKKGLINVIELKKEKVSVSAFFQALSYVKGIQRYLKKYRNDYSDYFNYQITLIGKDIDKNSSLVYLPEFMMNDISDDEIGFENKLNLEIYTYKFDINGLFFKEENGYKLIKEGF